VPKAYRGKPLVKAIFGYIRRTTPNEEGIGELEKRELTCTTSVNCKLSQRKYKSQWM